ncbi:hypothetical protein MLD38_007186 [Melastoma candidum]|uniref:Uncharacterized protein n=1 Tax=Melastoma candidum TaxID=119954 RepID=A0ACB9RQ04_9MYRT|nr:hypothetical protein MLD38_007186 [Melastoma candidum]
MSCLEDGILAVVTEGSSLQSVWSGNQSLSCQVLRMVEPEDLLAYLRRLECCPGFNLSLSCRDWHHSCLRSTQKNQDRPCESEPCSCWFTIRRHHV